MCMVYRKYIQSLFSQYWTTLFAVSKVEYKEQDEKIVPLAALVAGSSQD